MILFETSAVRDALKPFTLTRPAGMLRVGIRTLAEKWEDFLAQPAEHLCPPHFGHIAQPDYQAENLYVNAVVFPDEPLADAIRKLPAETALWAADTLVAVRTTRHLTWPLTADDYTSQPFKGEFKSLRFLPDLFLNNAAQIEADFNRLTAGRTSAPIEDPHTRVYGAENIFIEEGANIKAAIISAENGHVYVGKNAVVQEGSLIIGPAAICEESMVAFGAKIRPNVTLGPVCRVGGEVGNSIFMGYSNKAHDGFLGNSVIGEWCNLGANTNNSNLKNDYKTVKLHHYGHGGLVDTGELFCGTFMGDYSKAGISTMFNTGTVVGVSSNVFGAGFQEKHIPSFRWGGAAEGYELYRFEKAIEVINATMARRGRQLSPAETELLGHIFEKEAEA